MPVASSVKHDEFGIAEAGNKTRVVALALSAARRLVEFRTCGCQTRGTIAYEITNCANIV